jgi:hypothetical protein
VIKITLKANVSPLPDYVKRINGRDIEHGQSAGPANVWPASHPSLDVEKGERVTLGLRLRPAKPAGALKVALLPNTPSGVKLRRETTGTGYWLDVATEPITSQTSIEVPLRLESDTAPSDLTIKITLNVPAANLVATPKQLELGVISLSDLKSGTPKVGRLGVRKLVGSFRITALRSSLPFLSLEQKTIVDGSNYLIRVAVNPSAKPGEYAGTINVETDDHQHLEVPVKLTISER